MAINEQEIQEIVRNVLKGMGTATAPAYMANTCCKP